MFFDSRDIDLGLRRYIDVELLLSCRFRREHYFTELLKRHHNVTEVLRGEQTGQSSDEGRHRRGLRIDTDILLIR